MTTDLIQRLRFLASGQDDPHSQALTEAAAELERLRAQVKVQQAGVPALAELRERFAGIPDASGKGAAEPSSTVGEREAFEAHVSEGGKYPVAARRCHEGEYPFSRSERSAWVAALEWQARHDNTK